MNARFASSDPVRRQRRAAHLWFAGVIVLLGAGVWGGCSVKEHYDLLSFFFDGVPDPNAPLGVMPVGGGIPASYKQHKPYANGSCTECHPKLFVPVQNGSQICIKCHEGKEVEYPRMHGPVAASACLYCHSPHDSFYPALLRREPQELCQQCHDSFLLDSETVEAHGDDSRSCLECHSGHGGTDPYFLLESATTEPEPTESGSAGEETVGPNR